MAARKPKPGADDMLVIKKYANRRLYHTQNSRYITLEDVRELIHQDVPFVVQDAKTGEDLTRQVLTQIILEQESGSHPMLPLEFLKQVIAYYDKDVQHVMPEYFGAMVEHMRSNQELLNQYAQDALGNMQQAGGVFPSFAELQKQQQEFFKHTMEMWRKK